MLWVEPLARKSDVLAAFMRFKAAAENESDHRLHRFRSDNGGEFVSHAFNDYLHKHGIARETPPPYSPHLNGVAERVNRSIVEGIISLLNQPALPMTSGLKPCRQLLATWRGRPVRVDTLRVWGCRTWHTVTHGRSKLDDKAVPLVFIGYEGDTAAYRLLAPASGKIVRSRDARFVEHEFPLHELPAPPSGVPQQAVTPAFDLVISTGAVAAAAPERQLHTPTPPAAARAIPPEPARAQSERFLETPRPARPHLERAARLA
ncbi:hypothetical protein JCM3770_004612 [Rhodotorula araucariae]